MEVHHHAHSSPAISGTSRKKWTHYFWEFLMLFLAVFCGFLAENQREHMIEHQREKQFIKSLIRDVEMDTARFVDILTTRNRRDKMLDSLSMLINRPDAAAFSNTIYFFAAYATRGIALRYTPNDGTMQQLKNAGNLRLIKNQNIRDSIISFDVEMRAMVRQGESEEDYMSSYRDVAQEIFSGRDLDNSRDENNYVIRLNYNPSLRLDADKVFKLTYRIHTLRNINKANRRDLKRLLAKANNLLVALKKEYHLK